MSTSNELTGEIDACSKCLGNGGCPYCLGSDAGCAICTGLNLCPECLSPPKPGSPAERVTPPE